MNSLLIGLFVLFAFGSQYHAEAFAPSPRQNNVHHLKDVLMGTNHHEHEPKSFDQVENQARRAALARLAFGLTAGLVFPSISRAEEESIFAPKFVQEYPDFTQAGEGWSYKDVKVGSGESPKSGDRVVYEWSGYTIGYFGRPFEAKG